jgi:hypothetical protein
MHFDAESTVFVVASESANGKAAVIFAGTWSGTMAYYEFECAASTPTSNGAAAAATGFGLAAAAAAVLL